MRRADRLFQIVQLLRTHRVMTARQLADRLDVTERTIYRDMQDLSLSSVPIISETGVGYSMDASYNLPPITFSESELESLMLGARMVQAWSDRQMASEATRVIEKVESVISEKLKQSLKHNDILVPDFHLLSDVAEMMPGLRGAIRRQNKTKLAYQAGDGNQSQRVVWPLGLFFWGSVWTMVSWCELRNDFRQFRLDRIEQLDILDICYSTTEEQTLNYFLLQVCNGENKKKM